MNDSKTINRTARVKNDLGMHARPASRIAQMAEDAKSEIWLRVNSTRVDATSIIDILTLCAVKGTEIVIEINDQDDVAVMNRIFEFFDAGFGEECSG